jgi:hypothetical protein
MINNGVDQSQLISNGKAFSKQISQNTYSLGGFIYKSLEYNRRVEFVVISQGNPPLRVEQIEVPEDLKLDNEISK